MTPDSGQFRAVGVWDNNSHQLKRPCRERPWGRVRFRRRLHAVMSACRHCAAPLAVELSGHHRGQQQDHVNRGGQGPAGPVPQLLGAGCSYPSSLLVLFAEVLVTSQPMLRHRSVFPVCVFNWAELDEITVICRAQDGDHQLIRVRRFRPEDD